MPMQINDAVVSDEAIRREAMQFAGASDPEASARRALAIRELLLQRAGELGLLENGLPRERVTFASREAEDALIERVLDIEVKTPTPSRAECLRFYEANRERFTAGELCEARHILFAVRPGTPVGALREQAERTLAELTARPDGFAEYAQRLSNCPSGRQGGSLSQFGPGQMVPEFDAAIFDNAAIGVLPRLVTTRHGFHVVLVERRIAGHALPFEDVEARIGGHLAQLVQQRALHQYIQLLAGQAAMTEVDLGVATSPLVQ